MMQLEQPDDFVIATGKSYSLEEFVETAFLKLNLDWKKYVTMDKGLMRPTDLEVSKANPSKAMHVLGWEAKYKMKDVISMMIEEERKEDNNRGCARAIISSK